jgi:hypothetical protein
MSAGLLRVAPDRIESGMTITDPATLTRPWTIHIAYVWEKQVDRLIHDGDMFENDRSDRYCRCMLRMHLTSARVYWAWPGRTDQCNEGCGTGLAEVAAGSKMGAA